MPSTRPPTQFSYQQRRHRRAAMAAAVARGVRLEEVARRFVMTESTVRRGCWEAGLRFGVGGNAGRSAAASERYRRIASAIQAGRSVAQVARQHRVSEQTVRIACQALEVDLAAPEQFLRSRSLAQRRALAKRMPAAYLRRLSPERAGILRRLLYTSMTYDQIGLATMCSRQRVGQVWADAKRDAKGWPRLAAPSRARRRRRTGTPLN